MSDEIQELRETRSALWAAACAKRITVEELYAGLAAIRRRGGNAVYDVPRFGRQR